MQLPPVAPGEHLVDFIAAANARVAAVVGQHPPVVCDGDNVVLGNPETVKAEPHPDSAQQPVDPLAASFGGSLVGLVPEIGIEDAAGCRETADCGGTGEPGELIRTEVSSHLMML